MEGTTKKRLSVIEQQPTANKNASSSPLADKKSPLLKKTANHISQFSPAKPAVKKQPNSNLKNLVAKHRDSFIVSDTLNPFANFNAGGSRRSKILDTGQIENVVPNSSNRHNSSMVGTTDRSKPKMLKIHQVVNTHVNNINIELLKVFIHYSALPVYGIDFKKFLTLLKDLNIGIEHEIGSFTHEITSVFKEFAVKEGNSHYIFYEKFVESLRRLSIVSKNNLSNFSGSDRAIR